MSCGSGFGRGSDLAKIGGAFAPKLANVSLTKGAIIDMMIAKWVLRS